jgi:chemotaxis protein CheX
MKIEWINPFVESVYSLCTTMLSCTVERGQLGVANKKATPGGDITGLIGLSGPVRGMVALSFPNGTARAMVGRLLSLGEEEIDESVGDGVAELVNIIAGSAKARFSNGNGTDIISLGLPTVVHGGSEMVEGPSHSTWLDVPFASELGPFSLRVTFEMNSTQEGRK